MWIFRDIELKMLALLGSRKYDHNMNNSYCNTVQMGKLRLEEEK